MKTHVDTIREERAVRGDILHAVSDRGGEQSGFARRTYTECGIHIENPGLSRTSAERTQKLRLIGPILDIRCGRPDDVTCPDCRVAMRDPS